MLGGFAQYLAVPGGETQLFLPERIAGMEGSIGSLTAYNAVKNAAELSRATRQW